MNRRRSALIVGLVLALGTGIMLYSYLTAQATPPTKQRVVVVAARDIPARVIIEGSMVRSESRPAAQVDADAVSDVRQAIGKFALITVPVGSTITGSKIGAPQALALPRRLNNGLRAVSISIDKVKGVSGLVEPGDRVDVIAVPPRVASETPKAATIIRGALVLALGGETETVSATPNPQNANLTTVTLALTPKQANLIALADVNTALRLALRSPQEPIRAFPTEPLELGAPAQSAPAEPAAVPAPVAAVPPALIAARPARPLPPPLRSAVTLIDGDRVVSAGGTGQTR